MWCVWDESDGSAAGVKGHPPGLKSLLGVGCSLRFMRFMLLARSTLKTPWGVLSYVIDMDYTDVVQLSMCDPTLRVVGALMSTSSSVRYA